MSSNKLNFIIFQNVLTYYNYSFLYSLLTTIKNKLYIRMIFLCLFNQNNINLIEKEFIFEDKIISIENITSNDFLIVQENKISHYCFIIKEDKFKLVSNFGNQNTKFNDLFRIENLENSFIFNFELNEGKQTDKYFSFYFFENKKLSLIKSKMDFLTISFPCSVTKNNDFLIIGHLNGSISLYSYILQNSELQLTFIKSINCHYLKVSHLLYFNNQYVFTGSADGQISCLNFTDKNINFINIFNKEYTFDIYILKKYRSTHILSYGLERILKIWDINSKSSIKNIEFYDICSINVIYNFMQNYLIIYDISNNLNIIYLEEIFYKKKKDFKKINKFDSKIIIKVKDYLENIKCDLNYIYFFGICRNEKNKIKILINT